MQHIAQYPELAAEVKAIEEGMLAFAQTGAENPPAFLKEQIWDAIVHEQTAVVVPPGKNEEEPGDKVRPFTVAPSKPSWQRAAMWAAVVVSVLTNFILLSQKNKLQEEQVVLQQKVDSIHEQQQYLAGVVATYNKERDMLADTSMQAVLMKTMQPGHPMAATVYWSKQKGETYLAVQKLPPPPSGKQYQMWVIQDGKPVSMGVIPDEVVIQGGMTKLDMHLTNGQAFAISLEKAGGSPTPTMEQIQVLGKAS